MKYKSMWEKMKSTYVQRVEKLELEGKRGSTAWLNAKRFIDVMEGFELSETETK